MRRNRPPTWRVLGSLSIFFCSGLAMAYEEPEYVVVYESNDYEVRNYAPYNVAETVVDGDFGSAGNRAFRILAGYIFGDNRASEKMQMTAPVESRPAEGGIEMEMTVPVESSPPDDTSGRYVYRFVMERKYDFDELPEPNDPRVELRRVPPRTMAVHRYSGFWSEGNYERHETKLLTALESDDVDVIGEPLLARYNGPFTPFFMRRNEVMVEVAWQDPETDAGN